MEIQSLPFVNACLNGVATCLILGGLVSIKAGWRAAHWRFMVAALLVSAAFLGCYLYYHFNIGAVTRFSHGGLARVVYYFILLTHIPLAVVTLPLVVLTVLPAIRGEYSVHKRWARVTVPVWLYVSVTGVLVYLMLYVWFPSRGLAFPGGF
jgi:putative membrane protein